MSYLATVFKVMIASPVDVGAERGIIREMVLEWDAVNSDTRKVVLLAVGWETHSAPEMGNRPQAIINKRVLRDCDLLVGVFWTRIGTATGEYVSGTVEEIEEHLKAGKQAMLYFSSAPVVPDSVDSDQYAALRTFKDSCKSRGIFEEYSNLADFRSKFYRQLQIRMNQPPFLVGNQDAGQPVIVRPQQAMPFDLSHEARVLLLECAADPNGTIMRVSTMSGTMVQIGMKNFVADNTPRSVALWEGALEELRSQGLVSSIGLGAEIFKLTRKGYELADLLRNRRPEP
jgi:hypothetical protein